MRPTTATIVYEVARHCGVRVSDLRDPRRFPHRVQARRMAARALRTAGLSLNEIGEAINRDHTTVMHMLETSTPDEDRQAQTILESVMGTAREGMCGATVFEAPSTRGSSA